MLTISLTISKTFKVNPKNLNKILDKLKSATYLKSGWFIDDFSYIIEDDEKVVSSNILWSTNDRFLCGI